MKLTKVLIAASLFSSLSSAPLWAADFSADNYLTGDLLGWRSQLHDSGFDFNLGYTFETGGNLSGGDDHAYSYVDQTALGMVFDLDKLIGLPHASFHFSLVNRGGQAQDINDKAGLGDQMQSLEVYGRGRVTRISQFYYQEDFLQNMLEMKLGRMSFGDEFGSFQCEFAYLGLCGSQSGNFNSLYNWPISQWAGTLKYEFVKDWYAKVGLYQHNPGWLENGQGWNFGNPSGTDGITLPVEFGWTPTIGGMPGTYKIGYWWDTAGGEDIYHSGKNHSRKSGFYFLADQQVMTFGGDSSRGLNVYLYETVNDKDINNVDRSLAAGVTFKGPLACRPKDKWGIGAVYLHFSDRLADLDRMTANTPIQTDQFVFASYYKVQVTNYIAIRPEIQYLNHPGGTGHNANAWVATLKGDIQF
ncbi:carbohydrate porin [Celerinatantimonas sp. YJH-8]|uniref:carbohydrate porin n=1 Tax=Celerinatantimonas sp. YJH-8 TaxID=3228714 RepID=UPI0038CA82A1